MNISSISNLLPGNGSPPVAAEASVAEIRQARTAKTTDTAKLQTAQAIQQTSQTSVSKEEVEKAVKEVNDFLKPLNNSLSFNIDRDTGVTVVKVIDTSSDEVIRQFPSEEMLSIAKAIDKMKGLLVQQKA